MAIAPDEEQNASSHFRCQVYSCRFADLLSAAFGTVGAIIFALPLLRELKDRRHWERIIEFISRPGSATSKKIPAELEAEREIRDQFINSRLGDYERARFNTLFGSLFLVFAFVFLGIAAIDRLVSGGL